MWCSVHSKVAEACSRQNLSKILASTPNPRTHQFQSRHVLLPQAKGDTTYRSIYVQDRTGDYTTPLRANASPTLFAHDFA